MTHECEFIFVGMGIPYAYVDFLRFEKFKKQDRHRWTNRDELNSNQVKKSMLRPCDDDCEGKNHVMFCPSCQSVKKSTRPSFDKPVVAKLE